MSKYNSRLFIFCALLGFASLVQADFSGSYDPANWNFFTNGNGYVDTTGAPASIALVGSDFAGCPFSSFPGDTDYTTTASCDGTVSFDWMWETYDRDGPSFDPAGYLFNGSFTQLSNNAGGDIQSGQVTLVNVLAGDSFGFRVSTNDGICGPSAFTSIYNFSAGCDTSIDIKPGSDPNSINKKNKNGVIPVAILGSDGFDVTDVDVTSLGFEGASPAHDLTDPFVYAEHTQDVNLDGHPDLVSHYPAQDTSLTTADTEGCITGANLGGETLDGACDSVRVIKD